MLLTDKQRGGTTVVAVNTDKDTAINGKDDAQTPQSLQGRPKGGGFLAAARGVSEIKTPSVRSILSTAGAVLGIIALGAIGMGWLDHAMAGLLQGAPVGVGAVSGKIALLAMLVGAGLAVTLPLGGDGGGDLRRKWQLVITLGVVALLCGVVWTASLMS
jgi:hypothetical protein